MKSNLLVKSLLGAVIMSFLTLAFTEITGGSHNIRYYLWSIPANFLVTLALGYYIVNSRYGGLKLCAHVFTIFYVIGFFNIMIEALIFNVSDRPETINALIGGFFLTLSFTPLYVYILGKWKHRSVQINFQPRSLFTWGWKITAVVLLYFILYIAAGLTLATAYPELLEFYEGKIPAFELIFKTQLFRGLIFAGVAVLILKTTDLTRIKAALLVGVIFSILGGIAPLIPPNELMPSHIRLAHGFEVGISNLIYGMLAAYLLIQNLKTEHTTSSNINLKESHTAVLH